jgi:hypothetical protein
MKVYIAGPMTGKPAYNNEAFMQAAGIWSSAGHTPITPFAANHIVFMRRYGRLFNPHDDQCEYGDAVMLECVAEDMRILCEADAIALLPGWAQSRGALVELALARNLGKKVFDAVTMKEVMCHTKMVPAEGAFE